MSNCYPQKSFYQVWVPSAESPVRECFAKHCLPSLLLSTAPLAPYQPHLCPAHLFELLQVGAIEGCVIAGRNFLQVRERALIECTLLPHAHV